MSEGQLQRIAMFRTSKTAHSRDRAANGGRLASASAWTGDDREPATTAYDDLWFLGRPKLP